MVFLSSYSAHDARSQKPKAYFVSFRMYARRAYVSRKQHQIDFKVTALASQFIGLKQININNNF